MQPQVSHPSTAIPAFMLEQTERSKPLLFPLGRIVCTRNALLWAEEMLPDSLLKGNLWAFRLIFAHSTGCWDEMDESDQRLNRAALDLDREERIFSVYEVLGQKIYVITEWDRSYTTVMLAEDY